MELSPLDIFGYAYLVVIALGLFGLLCHSLWAENPDNNEAEQLTIGVFVIIVFWPLIVIIAPLLGAHYCLRWLVQKIKHKTLIKRWKQKGINLL